MSEATSALSSAPGQAAGAWPAVSLAEAHALLTAPGAMFEMETLTVGGRTVRVWKNGPKTLVEVLALAQGFGERIFLVHEDERVSFDAFARAASAFARTLGAYGVRPGDRVALTMRNLPEWPVVFFGCFLAGAVATPLNAWWSAAELAHTLKDSGAVVAVFDAERYERVGDMLAACAEVRHVFVSRMRAAPTTGAIRLEDAIGDPGAWATLPPAGPPPALVGPEDNATLLYTSGTSSRSKGVLATHRMATIPILAVLLSQARAFVRRGAPLPTPDPSAPQSCTIMTIPFFHVTGCFAFLSVSMAMGTRLVLMRRFEPETAMALIERERATSIGGVPAVPWQLLEHPSRHRYDLSSLEAISYGGAPAAPELVRRMAQSWPHAMSGSGWGMTETCSTFTHHFAEDYANRPESCGPATPVGDMKIVGPDGGTLPIGETGELWVRGPHVVQSYWNNPEATASGFADGWLKTGDLARLDEEGFCTIVDRLKDVIIRGGENIYSIEVEDALYDHSAVMDAALVPIADPVLGEVPGAVVTVKPGFETSEAELRAHVAERLAAFKVPVRVLLRREPLPRNANGKILKPELRRLFADISQSRQNA